MTGRNAEQVYHVQCSF